jgi:hypothetical protein
MSHKYRATGVDTNGDGKDDTVIRTAIVGHSISELKRKKAPRNWTEEENELLRKAVALNGEKHWKEIAKHIPNRNHTQCLQR